MKTPTYSLSTNNSQIVFLQCVIITVFIVVKVTVNSFKHFKQIDRVKNVYTYNKYKIKKMLVIYIGVKYIFFSVVFDIKSSVVLQFFVRFLLNIC